MNRARRDHKGFNLVETIVASAILSGAVLTVGAISTRALTGTRFNRQREVAASLAEKQLSLIDYIGIDEFLDTGTFQGDFTEYEPGYHWEVTTEYQGVDNLYLVTITIGWVENNRVQSLVVETMLNGLDETTSETTETTEGTAIDTIEEIE